MRYLGNEFTLKIINISFYQFYNLLWVTNLINNLISCKFLKTVNFNFIFYIYTFELLNFDHFYQISVKNFEDNEIIEIINLLIKPIKKLYIFCNFLKIVCFIVIFILDYKTYLITLEFRKFFKNFYLLNF